MNFAEYKVIKNKLEKRAKVLSFIPIILIFAVLFQIAFLIAGVSVKFDYFNLSLIEQLFTNASMYYGVGNVVMAIMFYGAVGISMVILFFCSILCYQNVRFGYSLLCFLYALDTIIVIVAQNTIQMAVHFVLLIGIFIALRTLTLLSHIPSEVWGYDEDF